MTSPTSLKGFSRRPLRKRHLGVLGLMALVDLTLRGVAAQDLAKRPARSVRGSKGAWRVVLGLMDGAALGPLAYLLFGRRKKDAFARLQERALAASSSRTSRRKRGFVGALLGVLPLPSSRRSKNL